MELRGKNILYIFPHLILIAGIIWMHFSYADGVINVMGKSSDLSQNSILQPRGGDIVSSIQYIGIQIIKAAKIALNGVALLAMAYV